MLDAHKVVAIKERIRDEIYRLNKWWMKEWRKNKKCCAAGNWTHEWREKDSWIMNWWMGGEEKSVGSGFKEQWRT